MQYTNYIYATVEVEEIYKDCPFPSRRLQSRTSDKQGDHMSSLPTVPANACRPSLIINGTPHFTVKSVLVWMINYMFALVIRHLSKITIIWRSLTGPTAVMQTGCLGSWVEREQERHLEEVVAR